ncbi:1-acyl-sn-glycerol-3-phosphate acyltransferase [Polymorphobacter multimanifer]|uniref:lysophospholipid acyltransferase family protein n=1 Tax=Polymorphobacter multimanifer TaxID=1070431 RepID=UPI0019BCB94E|nr:1-acyl-sn-glycerol-3-phosphate acyltransferase [Polymorphobacter multimanifer]GGI84901.1 1-acyl-sn-glycerol-3-phosphate acyltransferase [Polymorphobacter multimanifer]
MGPLKTVIRHPLASLRLALRVAALLVALAITLPGHWLAKPPSPWPRRFLAATSRILGVRITSQGRPLLHDVFHVANHIGWIDIPILASLTGTAFVAQDKIRDWPIVGWLARLHNTVFVSRTDRRSVGTQAEELRAALAERQPVAIFPEGTTTDGRSLLPFKPALFAVLMPPPRRIVIQPVAICLDDPGRDLAWIGEETAPENAWRAFTRPRPIHCHLRLLEPFDPGDHPDRKTIAAQARTRIAAALAEHYGHPVP